MTQTGTQAGTLFGPWIERLEAIAAGRELIAVAGRRDAAEAAPARVHVIPATLLDGKGASWSLDPGGAGAAVCALGFAGDDLLLGGSDDGRLIAWDVTGRRVVAELALGAAVRSLALDAGAARGDAGTIAVGTADGALHLVTLAIRDATPVLGPVERRALSDAAVAAVAWDPAGLWVAGGADGQLWILGEQLRAVAPGGDGGIRAIACIGDGRAAIGCGDGSLRVCFLVGDVEAIDRSGDHGHVGAVRALALGPLALDDTGRELPRRLFSVGEDGALKAWLVDGNRRPRTIELGLGPTSALVFAPGPVVKPVAVDKAAGRLWIASTQRKVAAIALGPEVDPAGEPITVGSELDHLEARLRDGKAAVKVKLEAVNALARIAEDEARVLLDLALETAPAEARVAATQAMVRSNRKASRPALRAALVAAQPELRGAAFHALRELEREQPLAAVRAGLAASFEDVRVRAVEALIPLARTSVIAAGMIAEAMRDAHPAVRQRAYAALREVVPDPAAAIRTALARGTPDVRAEALLDLGFVVRDAGAEARALTAGAFDDADAGVRAAAFLAALVQRPALAARLAAPVTAPAGAPASRLAAVDAGLADRFAQVAQQTRLALPADAGGALEDDQLEPLFAQLACRSADAAIRGAGCLLVLEDRRAVGAVLQLTREADPVLRRAATANLVRALATWPDDDRLSTRLAWLLDDGDPEVRSFAFDALARAAGADPAAELELELAETALRTSQEDIRVRALQILVRVGAPGAPVAATGDRLLGDALDDEAAKVRHEAFRTLQTWHAAAPMISLARGAHSRHGDLRTLVVTEIDRRRQATQSTAEMDRLLLELVRDPVAAVGLAAYTALTRQPDDGVVVAIAPEVHVAAMASPAPAVRAAGAKGAAKAPAKAVRARLVQLVRDDQPAVHTAAIEALDTVAPDDAEGFALAFASVFYELQVRAGELAGRRRDARAVAPMQRLLAIPVTDVNRPAAALRQRAAHALADAADPSTIAFQLGLIEDPDPIVREMAARGLATAARPELDAARTALVALLGHADLAVRSWAGEGLAKLGDLRALPVLAGTQRHDHRPLRIGAIIGFVALGPDGVRGLRQGLEDREREIGDLAFAVIVARDAALAAAGIAPDLLVDAMSSPSPEIRFAAARLFERRAAGDALDGRGLPPAGSAPGWGRGSIDAEAIGELVGPRKPDKAAELKDWPTAARRAALLQVLADAIASDEPGRRYAATQVLALRTQPLTFWREAARLAGPATSAPAPYTSGSPEARVVRRSGWLRRLVGERRDPEASELEALARLFLRAGRGTDGETAAAQRLVFGVYAGLIRQAPARGAADETHRVRRDAIGRLVELAREDAVGPEAVLPVLGHAVGDPHHLVRQAAMAALRSLYPVGALAPLQMAIAGAADLGKAAIDELVGLASGGDDRARALIRGALDADDAAVRTHAARRLVRLYPAGSAEPRLLAAQSRHADVRLEAITELAAALEAGASSAVAGTITEALVAALASEHADLRLRAASALARRGDPLGIEVLGGFLRDEDHAVDALESLQAVAGRAGGDGAAAAAEAIAARIDELDRTGERHGLDEYDEQNLVEALGAIGLPLGAPVLVRRLVAIRPRAEDEPELDVVATLAAILAILMDRTAKPRTLPDGRVRSRLRDELALTHLGDLMRSPRVDVRILAATALGNVDAPGAEDLLARLLGDRDPTVRVAAAEALALRAEYVPGATLTALEAALRGGRRELVLPAALGLAARKRPEAFQPLLLVAKAGEPREQERALLALGSLGDRRALDHLQPLLEPAPDDEVGRALTPAAVEAMGRLLPALVGDEAAEVRARVERLATGGAGAIRLRALTGLRYAGELGLLEAVAADREAGDALRVHAVEQLGLAASASSEGVLAELLSDDNYATREAAFAALGKVLRGDRTRVSLHALGAPHEHISRPAATYLATAGDPVTLVARLGSVQSAEVRRMLREGLIRRGALPVAELAAALGADDAVPRAEAAWIAGNAGAAASALAPGVAASVTRSAAQLGARRTALGPAQLAEIEAEWAALWAARRIGAAAAVEGVAQALLADERAPTKLRREAASVLAASGSGAAFGALTAWVGDADREVRAVAADALGASQPQLAVSTVRALGSRADASTIARLALVGWPQLAAELIAEPATRAWALSVSLIGNRADELVAIASGKGAPTARIAAIGALGRLGGEVARRAVEAIHASATEDDAIKLAAWKALKRIGRASAKKTYAEGEDKGPTGTAAASAGGEEDDVDEDDEVDEDVGVDDDDDADDDDVSDDDDDDDDDDDEDDVSDDDDDDADDAADDAADADDDDDDDDDDEEEEEEDDDD